jgi:hypothetical protein
LLGGVIIGLILILFGMNNQEFTLIPIIAVIVIMAFGITTIFLYYKFRKVCPNCKHNYMISVKDPIAQDIIKKHNIEINDAETYICTDCQYQGSQERKQSLIWSIIIIIFGIFTLPISLANNITHDTTSMSLIIL